MPGLVLCTRQGLGEVRERGGLPPPGHATAAKVGGG
jgi:hypothetical protein